MVRNFVHYNEEHDGYIFTRLCEGEFGGDYSAGRKILARELNRALGITEDAAAKADLRIFRLSSYGKPRDCEAVFLPHALVSTPEALATLDSKSIFLQKFLEYSFEHYIGMIHYEGSGFDEYERGVIGSFNTFCEKFRDHKYPEYLTRAPFRREPQLVEEKRGACL